MSCVVFCSPCFFDFVACHEEFQDAGVVEFFLVTKIVVDCRFREPSVYVCAFAQAQIVLYIFQDRRIDFAWVKKHQSGIKTGNNRTVESLRANNESSMLCIWARDERTCL